MDYWTYFAARSEDPARTGVVSFEGVGSFEAATSGRVDVKTDIRPLRAPAIVEARAVDGLEFDRGDVRGVTFDQPIPSRYQAGRRNIWSGVINTLSQRPNVNSVIIRFWKYGGGSGDSIRITGRVDRALVVPDGEDVWRLRARPLPDGGLPLLSRLRESVQPHIADAHPDRVTTTAGRGHRRPERKDPPGHRHLQPYTLRSCVHCSRYPSWPRRPSPAQPHGPTSSRRRNRSPASRCTTRSCCRPDTTPRRPIPASSRSAAGRRR